MGVGMTFSKSLSGILGALEAVTPPQTENSPSFLSQPRHVERAGDKVRDDNSRALGASSGQGLCFCGKVAVEMPTLLVSDSTGS